MKDLYQEHILITNEVKRYIKDLQVVFPANYGNLYARVAQEANMELEPNQLISYEMLDEKTVRHIINLADYAESAIDAIETKNHKKLEKILEETKILREEIQLLQKVVYEDPLTKSHNRKWLEDVFLHADKKTFSKNGILSMVDMDDFKRINDTYGHTIGDKVLIHISTKLKESGGQVLRYGGDEFLVMFDKDITLDVALEKMEVVHHFFKKVEFKVEKGSFKFNFSYGLSVFNQGEELVTVLNIADKAMYLSKNSAKKNKC